MPDKTPAQDPFNANLTRFPHETAKTLYERVLNLDHAVGSLFSGERPTTLIGDLLAVESGRFDMFTGKIIWVGRGAGEDVFLHEMVHFKNRANKRFLIDRLSDEGMAYVVQNYYNLGFDAVHLQIELEKNRYKTGSSCGELGESLGEIWRDFWRSRNSPEKLTKGVLKVGFAVTPEDVSNVDRHLGARLSCSRFADLLNSYFIGCGTCFEFVCDEKNAIGNYANARKLSPGVEIHESFR